MRYAIALVAVALLVLAACKAPEAPPTPEVAPSLPAPAEKIEEAPPAAPAEDDTAERLAEEQKEKIIEYLETPPKLEPRDRTTIVEQMWDIASKLESYQFKTLAGAWFVRGEKVKHVPFNAIRKTDVMAGGTKYREVFIDEVFFDREERTATGYCTGWDENVRKQCASLGILDIAFPLSYDELMIKLPEDWVKEYLGEVPTEEEYEKYYVKNVLTNKAVFKDGVQMFFNPRAGLPLQIILGPLDKVSFDDLVINQVRPEQVVHRSRSEIPPEEMFYQPKY